MTIGWIIPTDGNTTLLTLSPSYLYYTVILHFLKRVFLLYSFFTAAVCLLPGGCYPQSNRSLFGREFWVTFTENNYSDTFNHLLITPTVKDTISVFNPQLNATYRFIVFPGQQNIVRIPKTSLTFWYSPFAAVPQNTGARVSSRRAVFSCQAVNTISASTDAAALLPAHVLSNAREYLVHTLGGKYDKQSQAAVIAMDPGTTVVEITAGCDLTGMGGKGTVFTRNLKQGQVFVIQALDTQNLTGTRIRVKDGCNRIAVFACAKCARVPDQSSCNGCDVLYEQQLPSWSLGKKYYIPRPPLSGSWLNGVAALYDNTSISIDGNLPFTLNKGDWRNWNATAGQIVTSDKPLSCMQVLKSSGCNGSVNPSGDPSLLSIAPERNGTLHASTSVYRNAGYSSSLVLIAASLNTPVIRLNGTAIPASAFTKVSNAGGQFWYCTQAITFNKTWDIASDSVFWAYQYGLANSESYATCVGITFPNAQADFDFSPSPVCDPQTPVTFSARGDSLGAFTWFFGDGKSGTGKTVSHIYGQTGVFTASIANPSLSGCTDTISLLVKVLQGPQMQVPRDTQPCIGSIYRIELPSNTTHRYLWENGSTSFFQSIPGNRMAILKTTDTAGCTSTDTIQVTYRNCNNFDLRLANVFTPNNDGFNDEWRVIYKAYEKVDIKIYNRWGELVYGYSLPDDPHWNGMVNNQFILCPEGVYFYILEAKEPGGKVKQINGSVNLIR